MSRVGDLFLTRQLQIAEEFARDMDNGFLGFAEGKARYSLMSLGYHGADLDREIDALKEGYALEKRYEKATSHS